MSIEFSLRHQASANRREPGEPWNVVIAGNFSGSAHETSTESRPRVREADPFDLDACMAKFSPEIVIDADDAAMRLHPRAMEDFLPDRLYAGGDLFRSLDELTRALADPRRSAEALVVAEELVGAPVAADTPPVPADSQEEPDMFERLLGRARGGSSQAGEVVRQLLADVAKDDAVDAVENRALEMRDQLQGLQQAAMREILRHPAYRAVETSWRSVEWLAQRLETEEELKFWLLDTAGQEATDWVASGLQALDKLLFDQSVALVTVLGDFGADDGSIKQLEALAELGSSLGCSVLTGADAGLAGLKGSPSEYFKTDGDDINTAQPDRIHQFRSASGSHLVLGFPRILLRQPYGKRSDPVESFPFEELERDPAHDAFSWGSAAIALAAVYMAQLEHGAGDGRIGDLPMVVYDDSSGQAIKPCSELYLSESADQALRANGITPLVSKRGENAVWIRELETMAL